MPENKKIIFIPGWLDCGEIHGYYNGLNIWENKIDFDKSVSADFIIGHSIGAALALHYWKKNNNLSVILVNPLISKKNLSSRWLKLMLYEGTHLPKRRLKIMGHIPAGILKLRQLLQIDQLKIIKKIPPEKLLVIRGKNDKYLCNNDSAQALRDNGIDFLELDGVGHNWHKKIAEIIKNYIDKHPNI